MSNQNPPHPPDPTCMPILKRSKDPASSCESGIGSRPLPGFQPQRTRGSLSICSTRACGLRLPLRPGSFNMRHSQARRAPAKASKPARAANSARPACG